jgi:hypothetical protein
LRQPLVGVLLAILVLACGAPTPTISPTAPPTGIPSLAATSSPVATATHSDPLGLLLPGPGTELEPGVYVKAGFTPTVAFAVGDGWTTVQQFPGFFDIQDEPGSLDVVAVQFANVSGTLDEVVEEVMNRPNTRVIESDESRLAELVGTVLVIETTDPADSSPPIFRPVLTVSAGPLLIASGRRLWLSLLPVSNGVLAVMVGGSIAEWDYALEIAEPVLESIVVTA